ncbi:MAG: diphthamide biosynthesis enzyme Dph2 [Candidatus Bathyarchaeota archaeon]|nr:MAG: diphthamide biosynthesis enzyme Dph2 [Candidatus Bathyarchaeota archaeon]
MRKSSYDFEIRKVRDEIIKREAKIILIQLPEGLKLYGPKLAEVVENAGGLAIIHGDPCYGACDVATVEAERLGADLIIHYGHSEMMEKEVTPTLFIEAKMKGSIKIAVKKAIPLIKNWGKIGLVTTVQHIHKLDDARRVLLDAGKVIIIGDAGRLKYAGQVIGCDYSNAKIVSAEVDVFLFVGGGRFHALGVALTTAKPTIVADPYEKRAFRIEDGCEKVLKKRWATIHEAGKSKNFGILIGLKTRQKRLDKALTLKSLLEKAGKKGTLIALKEITPEALMQFSTLDAFINTACPRLALDNSRNFHKPLLNSNEALVILGKVTWEELCEKGWFEN